MKKEKLEINSEKLECVRKFLIEEVFRNPNCTLNESIRGDEGYNPDLIEIICDLYEYLHVLIYDRPYDYMFHWCNKCGGWVETGEFDKIINEKMKE